MVPRSDRGRRGVTDSRQWEERLQALLSAETVTGAFTETDGQTHVFEAEPVDIEGDAGLYWSQPVEGEGLSSRGGTIIQADGEERGTNTFTCQANKVCVGTNKAATIRAKGGNGTIIARGGDDTIYCQGRRHDFGRPG